jgi:ASCH domain
MKALIIDEPWITAILKGDKTWEMRKKNCNIRGQIALVRKGSGHVVGTADVVGCRPPLATRGDYAAAEHQHRISPARQEQAFTDGWRTPWVLANARSLQKAVRYKHPPGAVVWVNLEPEVAAQVLAQATT